MLLGLAALIPAAINAPPALAGALTMPICSGDGHHRIETAPLDRNGAPPQPGACCAKGCHACPRKRGARLDSAQ